MDAGDAPRVDGCLMVSRAFGDFSMKFANGNRPTEAEWSADWSNGFRVVADPDIVVVPRPAGGALLAIYSDGLVETPDGDNTGHMMTSCGASLQRTGVARICWSNVRNGV